MLRIDRIKLLQYRNYPVLETPFEEGITGFHGPNGSGKTNILDAVHHLCVTKSYFGRTDASNTMHGSAGNRLEGWFDKQGQAFKVVSVLRENNKKEFSLNEQPYKKLSDHVGRFPCVMVAPDDVAIVTGASEERRRYLDTLACQLDPSYLQDLILYNRALQQRNALLKQPLIDPSLLDVLEHQMVVPGSNIVRKRSDLVRTLFATVLSTYEKIADGGDGAALSYLASVALPGDFATLLAAARQRDMLLQRSTVGPHKDDIGLYLNGRTFKSEASQGQRKSLLFALKLAEWLSLQALNGWPPILLLDDVFEKLDEKRMDNLLGFVGGNQAAQVLITDTHADRLGRNLANLGRAYKLIGL